jgi:hypothetical protein
MNDQNPTYKDIHSSGTGYPDRTSKPLTEENIKYLRAYYTEASKKTGTALRNEGTVGLRLLATIDSLRSENATLRKERDEARAQHNSVPAPGKEVKNE